MAPNRTRILGPGRREELLGILEARFEENPHRHRSLGWAEVRSRLEASPESLWSLGEMERTGGAPDVIGRDEGTGAFLFVDCSPESPGGRRSLCYDGAALEARKRNKPAGSAADMAHAMGAALLAEAEYRRLQALAPVDTKTSSWLLTPPEIRSLGGAIFGDHRFGAAWIYHNGAESYYAARGFRCALRV